MTIAETLLLDYDAEIQNTRRILERIPEDKPDWKPHDKSMPMGRLAVHVARLPDFATTILTTPELNLANHKFPQMVLESREKLLANLDETSTAARQSHQTATDEHLRTTWKLSWGDKTSAEATRAVLYR